MDRPGGHDAAPWPRLIRRSQPEIVAMSRSFDAIIIGAGQAGPSLALRLGEAGMKVAIVERKLFGGTCVNTGCTPTKTLVASAHAAHLARRAAEFDVVLSSLSDLNRQIIDFIRVRVSQEKNKLNDINMLSVEWTSSSTGARQRRRRTGRANEIVIRHLTLRTETRYRRGDKAPGDSPRASDIHAHRHLAFLNFAASSDLLVASRRCRNARPRRRACHRRR